MVSKDSLGKSAAINPSDSGYYPQCPKGAKP